MVHTRAYNRHSGRGALLPEAPAAGRRFFSSHMRQHAQNAKRASKTKSFFFKSLLKKLPVANQTLPKKSLATKQIHFFFRRRRKKIRHRKSVACRTMPPARGPKTGFTMKKKKHFTTYFTPWSTLTPHFTSCSMVAGPASTN